MWLALSTSRRQGQRLPADAICILRYHYPLCVERGRAEDRELAGDELELKGFGMSTLLQDTDVYGGCREILTLYFPEMTVFMFI